MTKIKQFKKDYEQLQSWVKTYLISLGAEDVASDWMKNQDWFHYKLRTRFNHDIYIQMVSSDIIEGWIDIDLFCQFKPAYVKGFKHILYSSNNGKYNYAPLKVMYNHEKDNLPEMRRIFEEMKSHLSIILE